MNYGKPKSSLNHWLLRRNRAGNCSLSFRKRRQNLRDYARSEKKDALLSEAKSAGVSVETLQLDVTDEKSIKSAVSAIMKKEGRIDVLVNNAGYGAGGFLEDFSMEEIRNQFETNFFGLVMVTKEVLSIMRKQRRGCIINISSIGGRIAFPVTNIYSASKFAVEAITESLRVELAPFGIKATAVEPSSVKTNFRNATRAAEKSRNPSSPYYEYMKKFENNLEKMRQGEGSTVVAKSIYAAITSKNPKRSYPVGKGARTLFILKPILPNSIFKWIMGRMVFG